jgi:purine-nucleoside/S-methyl-5'-thioadenosine phosphorylase / adenosine deaminase
MPTRLTHPALAALPGISHGFFTRHGGVSTGIYESLNCGIGSKDNRQSVLENRARATISLGIASSLLATPYQTHSSDTVVVTDVWQTGQGPKADAVVTNRPGIALGVGSADCGPTLFADSRLGVIGAAHSGWRGALGGVLESTVAAMERLGARRERIVAVLGPTISQPNYEVGPEFRDRFLESDPDNHRFFEPSSRPDHALFDLPAYIIKRLASAGVNCFSMALCTYADADRFFSYRRGTQRGEADYGRLLSAIALSIDTPTAPIASR